MTRPLPSRAYPHRPLFGALLAMVAVAVLTASINGIITSQRQRAGAPADTYCADVASARAPRCPPEPGSVVLGVWPTGAVASVEWTGSDWRLRVPGGGRVRVAAPPDWREP